MDRDRLIEASIDVIAGHQAPTGAYPASPYYPTYQYCWYRDGSFVARAMDAWDRFESATRFHDWAAETVLRHSQAAMAARADPASRPRAILDTRYHLDGSRGEEDWSNFQLDGFGTWLWSLEAHVADSGEPADRWRDAADLVADYLVAHWEQPCYDLWEEFPEHVHPYTLGAIHAGLSAHGRLTGADHRPVVDAIEKKLADGGTVDGRLVKYLGSEDVDASLMILGVPYGVYDPAGPVMAATIAAIEKQLTNGGVRRYPTDTFYGGGQWILLTAWLAWHHRTVGESDRAAELLAWVEEQADQDLHLPEQVPVGANDPDWIQPWVDRWGPVATPLLWSHAMYLLAVAT